MKASIFKYFFLISIISTTTFSQLGGYPGSFTRMGFSARGISMGNAMTAVSYGDVTGYYNPSVSVFQDDHLINLSYSFLSLDRSLNFISYTKNFKIPNQPQGGAGITFSWINAGVSNIDGRDADGYKIGTYSVSENQFAFSPAIKFGDNVSVGAAFKFYYSKLFTDITSTSLGFDLGALYRVMKMLAVGIAIKDLNSKYQWNTNDLYGQGNGATTIDKFPVLYDIGVTYLLPKYIGLISVEYEASNRKSNIFRLGGEISILKDLSFRAGVDRLDINSKDIIGNAKLTFGVGFQKPVKNFIVGFNYSFVLEPYTHDPFQTLTAVFKIK